MSEHIITEDCSNRCAIAKLESGIKKPSVEILLAYKELVNSQTIYNIRVDTLIEDDKQLPF